MPSKSKQEAARKTLLTSLRQQFADACALPATGGQKKQALGQLRNAVQGEVWGFERRLSEKTSALRDIVDGAKLALMLGVTVISLLSGFVPLAAAIVLIGVPVSIYRTFTRPPVPPSKEEEAHLSALQSLLSEISPPEPAAKKRPGLQKSFTPAKPAGGKHPSRNPGRPPRP